MAFVRTAFTAQDHGFRFVNAFHMSLKLDLPFQGSIDLGSIVLGFCGGMCFGALDYFHLQRPVPAQVTVPQQGGNLYSYLVKRQLDSFQGPVVPLTVIEWMLRSDKDVQRLTATREWPKVRRRLDRMVPATLCLVRAGGLEDPTQNHQVLTVGYTLDEASRDLTLYLYDPNHPLIEPELRLNLARPSQGISLRQSTGEELRGFFLIEHKPQTQNLPTS